MEENELEGLEYQHVGYIVDSAEHAIPEPPRPVPPMPAPARWPKWREASPENVADAQAAGAAWLQARGLDAQAPAAAILAALSAEIAAQRPGRTQLKRKALNALYYGVGGAWAWLLQRDCDWRWLEVPVTSRSWNLGLATPDGSHALSLDQVVERQLHADTPCTLTLMFNMIAAGQLLPGKAGEHVVIG
ncbi:MAG: hypothetical protein RJA98_4053 [Pseudomonadota bacterium]